jgi:hypothetical protein
MNARELISSQQKAQQKHSKIYHTYSARVKGKAPKLKKLQLMLGYEINK